MSHVVGHALVVHQIGVRPVLVDHAPGVGPVVVDLARRSGGGPRPTRPCGASTSGGGGPPSGRPGCRPRRPRAAPARPRPVRTGTRPRGGRRTPSRGRGCAKSICGAPLRQAHLVRLPQAEAFAVPAVHRGRIVRSPAPGARSAARGTAPAGSRGRAPTSLATAVHVEGVRRLPAAIGSRAVWPYTISTCVPCGSRSRTTWPPAGSSSFSIAEAPSRPARPSRDRRALVRLEGDRGRHARVAPRVST